jgi:hypothetical protein
LTGFFIRLFPAHIGKGQKKLLEEEGGKEVMAKMNFSVNVTQSESLVTFFYRLWD